MIKKILLLLMITWSFCIFPFANAANSFFSTLLLNSDSTKSIRFFPSVEISYDFLGSIPFTSINFEPRILENNNYFIDFQLSHSYWFFSNSYFQQISLLGGIKPDKNINFYGGIRFKTSSNTDKLLKNKMGSNLFASIGFKYITKSNIFIKTGFNIQLYQFEPSNYYGGGFTTINYFLNSEYYKTPYVFYGFGVGYLISNDRINHNNDINYFPKNSINLIFGLQFPPVSLSYERLLFHKGRYGLFTNLVLRYGKKDFSRLFNKDIYDIKNVQFSVENNILIVPNICWYFGFSDEYYYLLNNDVPVEFSDISAQTGLSFLISKHLSIKYFVNSPFYYFGVHPKTRKDDYLKIFNFISDTKISIGYSFGK